MKAPTASLALVAALLIAGCSATRTQIDYDREFDFATLETYGWEEVPKSDTVPNTVMAHIVSSVARTLEAKGFRPTEGEPDFVVSVRVEWELREKSMDWGSVDDYSVWWSRDVESYSYEEGALVVRMASRPGADPIWSGHAERVLDSSTTPEKTKRMIEQVVEKLLASFPPTG